jgi:hypothetical protein
MSSLVVRTSSFNARAPKDNPASTVGFSRRGRPQRQLAVPASAIRAARRPDRRMPLHHEADRQPRGSSPLAARRLEPQLAWRHSPRRTRPTPSAPARPWPDQPKRCAAPDPGRSAALSADAPWRPIPPPPCAAPQGERSRTVPPPSWPPPPRPDTTERGSANRRLHARYLWCLPRDPPHRHRTFVRYH